MVKNTKTWISWEQNIVFLRNTKILNLCFRWHILRSYRFEAEVTFKQIIFINVFKKRVKYQSFKKNFQKLVKVKLDDNFLWDLFLLFVNRNNICFFPEIRKSLLKNLQFLNMIESGFTILSLPSFNILMNTSLCPLTLLISDVVTVLYISSSSISKDDLVLFL